MSVILRDAGVEAEHAHDRLYVSKTGRAARSASDAHGPTKEQLCRALIEQGTDRVTVVLADGLISHASPADTS
jgi:hypothetical protein